MQGFTATAEQQRAMEEILLRLHQQELGGADGQDTESDSDTQACCLTHGNRVQQYNNILMYSYSTLLHNTHLLFNWRGLQETMLQQLADGTLMLTPEQQQEFERAVKSGALTQQVPMNELRCIGCVLRCVEMLCVCVEV